MQYMKYMKYVKYCNLETKYNYNSANYRTVVFVSQEPECFQLVVQKIFFSTIFPIFASIGS